MAEWVAAHAFHDDIDTSLTTVVGPLVAELESAGLAEEWFFLRYWDGGNHLRLRVRTREPDKVRDLVATRFRAYFAGRPAPMRATTDEYAAVAARLAALEGMREYTRQPYPADSVAFLPYAPEYHRYGRGAAMDAVERHFGESSQIALSVLAGGPSPAQRAQAGLALLLLCWEAAGGRAGYVPDPAPEATPEQMARAADLARRMRALTARVDALPAGGTLADWARSLARLRPALDGDRAPLILDTCGHLVCNRLGLPLTVEQQLRRLAGQARAALDGGLT